MWENHVEDGFMPSCPSAQDVISLAESAASCGLFVAVRDVESQGLVVWMCEVGLLKMVHRARPVIKARRVLDTGYCVFTVQV
jgi:hypothetical protein